MSDDLAHHQELVSLICSYTDQANTAIQRGDHAEAFAQLSMAWRLMLKTEWVRQSFVDGPDLPPMTEFSSELLEIQMRHMTDDHIEDRYHIGRIGAVAATHALRLAITTAAHPSRPLDVRQTGVNDIHVEVKFTNPKEK